MPLRSSEDHYRDLQRLSALAVAAGRRSWSRLDLNDLDASFREVVGPELLVMLSAAQTAAASESAAYVPRALSEQGIPDAPEGVLRPRSLAGVASDGRPLTGLLRSPLTRAKALVGAGAPDPIGSARGALDMIVQTQVMDAARVASSVSMVTRPNIQGYVRLVNLPACGRCLVLAGRYYSLRSSADFLRHPRCDCTAEPTNNRDAVTDPMVGFDNMTAAEQDKAFTKAGAQAIRDGADMGLVVNARRGMSTTQAYGRRYLTTTEGTTARGLFGRQQSDLEKRGGRYRSTAQFRLMPESIYKLASDRADAIRLLRRYGYVR